MRKIKLPSDNNYFGVTTKSTLIQLWEKQFLNESNKFISGTYLQPEDLGREFEDAEGEKWKIIGQMDGKDMPCEKLSTGEIFVWDKWKVSGFVHPEKHAKATKKVEFVFPKVKGKRTKKEKTSLIPIEKAEKVQQLDLFSSQEETTNDK
jgi:hypothetical protein